MSNRVYRYRQNSRNSDPAATKRSESLQSLNDSVLNQLNNMGLRVDDDGLLSDLSDFDEDERFAILGLFGLLGFYALLGSLERREEGC